MRTNGQTEGRTHMAKLIVAFCNFANEPKNVSTNLWRQSKHILYFVFNNVPPPPPPENRAGNKMMWKNFVERERLQMTTWSTRNICWIPKATNTPSECVILIAFTVQQWLHERASMLVIRTYIACLVLPSLLNCRGYLNARGQSCLKPVLYDKRSWAELLGTTFIR
jgi:hypothetical protein